MSHRSTLGYLAVWGWLITAAGAALVGCATQTGASAAVSTTGSSDHWIGSRDTNIPVTLVVPDAEGPVPLVLFLHGHGGSRHEAGGFTQVAEQLRAAGIASVRLDFPGCGESTEPFRNNRLQFMLADAAAALTWSLANANIDSHRMAVFGYSMGGRLAMHLSATDPRFRAMALWAPSADPGATALYDFFGGADSFARLRDLASRNGFAPFTTSWGQAQELSDGWFTDMAGSQPLKDVSRYPGDLLVLYGSEDQVVRPAESLRVVAAAQTARSTRAHAVQGADHGLGLFTNQPELTAEAVDQTAEFLRRALR